MGQQYICNICAGSLLTDRADLMGDHGHAIDDAGILVLPDGEGTFVAHLQQTVRAVLAHAGEDDADALAAHVLGHGAEQYVHRRTVSADFFTGIAAHGIGDAGAHHFHLQVAGGDEDAASYDLVSVFSLLRLHLADAVQAFCIHLGETFGHMLGDDDPRRVGRKIAHYFQRGFGAACGSSDRDHCAVLRQG